MWYILKINMLLILILLPLSVSGQEDSLKEQRFFFTGYIKNLQNITFISGANSPTSLNLIHNRLNFSIKIGATLSGRLEVRNRFFFGEQLMQIPDFGKYINQYNGFLNLSKLWVNDRSLVVHSVIDRALIHYAAGKWDIMAGRQRINWGINNVWNPNDIFNAYSILDFDYEERRGNDAIRIQYFPNDNSTLEFAMKPGKHKDDAIGAILYKFNRKAYDIQVLAGLFNSDYVVGGGWAGSIKNTGFKGEISYFHPTKRSFDTSGVVTFSIMADRTFKNDWYASMAYLYNSHASNQVFSGGDISNVNLSAKALFPFRHNIYAGLTKAVSPISSFNFSIIYSPSDHTFIFLPSYLWNVATNFDIDFTMQSFNGKQGTVYKSYINSLYIRGRWSF